MKAFAEELKNQRKTRGISLEELHERTRINLKFLQAIENGNFSILPEVYVRLFLKKYAQEVGLGVPETLAQYEKTQRPRDISVTAAQPERVRPPALAPILAIVCVLILAAIVGVRMIKNQEPTQTPTFDATQTAALETPILQVPEPDPASRRAAQTPPPAAEQKPTPESEPAQPEAAQPEPVQSESLSENPPPQPIEQESSFEDPSTETEITLPDLEETPEQPAETETTLPDLEETPEQPAETETAPPEPEKTPEQPEERVISAYSLPLGFLTGREDLLTLSVNALASTNMRVLADGELLFEGNLNSGAQRRWDAQNRFRIEIQNAAALSLSLQNTPIVLPENPGLKRRLFISRSSIWVEEIEPSAPATSR